MIALLAFIPALVNAEEAYQKIFKQVNLDRSIVYGSVTLANEAAEAKMLADKNNELKAKFKEEKEKYKKAMTAYKKSTAADKQVPAKVYTPSFYIEKKKYIGAKPIAKMKAAIEKKNKRVAENAVKAQQNQK